MKRPLRLAVARSGQALLGLLVAVAPAAAHHSFAEFDRTKALTMSGVVREVQWNNPHTWIQVLVTDAKGRKTEWGFECGSPNMMSRTGWKRTTLKMGDKVTVVGNPLKNGRTNALLVKITLPDGRVLGPGDAPPPKPLGSRKAT
jgi:hypothetical protein